MSNSRSFFARPPLAAWLVALAAALLHLAPLWRAQRTVGPDHTFTGCLATSPDSMQYRVWQRRTAHTGPITDNRFTTEPHRAYLPVFFYWGVGALARTVGAPPEFVYEWLGAPLAFALAMLLFLCARHFLGPGRASWWVFLATLGGGGLGAHLKHVAERGWLGPEWTTRLAQRLEAAPVWESYRSHYAFKVLFDTHFLVAWVFTILALLAFYAAALQPDRRRLAMAALASVLATLLHPYEGPLLLLVHAATFALASLRGLARRGLRNALLASALPTAATLALLFAVQSRSGLPIPDWRPPDVAALNVLLAYPLVALLALVGLARYWRGAELREVFLLGWSAACLAMTLSSPYYPYADRGPTTAQVPLFLVAGGIYFARLERVPWSHALLAACVLGVTPLREVEHRWRVSRFDAKRPAVFLSAERRVLVDALIQAAGETSVLLARPQEYRWLAPEFPGVSYDAHFFLTVDFERKRAEVDEFFASEDAERAARFLDERGIDFLHLPASGVAATLRDLEGWRALAEADGGVLLTRGGGDGGR